MKVSAEQLTKGQKFTYGAHSYTTLSVEVNPDTTVSVYTEEHPGLPMDFYSDEAILEAEEKALKPTAFELHLEEALRNAKRELAAMKDRREFNVPADHRMEYLDGTHRRTQYYTTHDGFLKAYIRMTENPSRYSILHAD